MRYLKCDPTLLITAGRIVSTMGSRPGLDWLTGGPLACSFAPGEFCVVPASSCVRKIHVIKKVFISDPPQNHRMLSNSPEANRRSSSCSAQVAVSDPAFREERQP